MAELIRVLLLEDDADDAELIIEELRAADYEPQWQRVVSEQEFRIALDTPFDLILSDYKLPQYDGLSALVLARAKQPDTPFILVSGTIGEERAVEAIKQGAADYLLKDRLARLGAAVHQALAQQAIRTENYRMHQALLAREKRFRALVEHNADAMALLGANGKITYASPAATDPNHISPELLLGTSGFETMHPDDVASAREILSQVYANPRATVPFLLRFQGPDGRVHWVEGTVTNLLDEPAVNAIVANYRDVTARVNAEKALRSSEALTRAILEAIPVNLAVLDASGTIIAVNSAWEKFARENGDPQLRYTGAGINYLQVCHAAVMHGDVTAAEPLAGIQAVMHGNRDQYTIEYPCHSPTEKRWYMMHVKPFQYTNGAIIIHSNVSERVLAQQHLERRAQEFLGLYETANMFSRHLDLEALLQAIVVRATLLLNAPSGAIYLYDAARSELHLTVTQQVPVRVGVRLPVGQGVAGRVAQRRETMNVSNYGEWDLRASELAEPEFGAMLAVPMIYNAELQGVLCIAEPGDSRRQFSNSDARLLELFAVQAASAVHNATLFQELQNSHSDLFDAYETTLEGWSRALDLRDKETEGHTRRVAEMTITLARALGMNSQELVHVRRGALLHDIGKMGIPDSILLKPGPLTEQEWVVMRKHPTYARELLSPIEYLRPALDIPYAHHEKWDGTGYPRGLRAQEIPLAARAFAIVDVWDALSSDRPYRGAWEPGRVREHIRALAGTHFDPAIVPIFLALLDNMSG